MLKQVLLSLTKTEIIEKPFPVTEIKQNKM